MFKHHSDSILGLLTCMHAGGGGRAAAGGALRSRGSDPRVGGGGGGAEPGCHNGGQGRPQAEEDVRHGRCVGSGRCVGAVGGMGVTLRIGCAGVAWHSHAVRIGSRVTWG